MRDRKKEEREILVKKAFLADMMKENYLLCNLLAKESSSSPVLWEPDMLPAPSAVPQSYPSMSNRVHDSGDLRGCYEQQKEINNEEQSSHKVDGCCIEKPVNEAIALLSKSSHDTSFVVPHKNAIHLDLMTSDAEVLEMVEDEGDLPVGLNVDSGSLACVACGILGFPFMAIVQPSEKASRMIFPITNEATHEKSDKSECLFPPCLQNDACNSAPVERSTKVAEQASHPTCEFSPASSGSSQHSTECEIAQCGNKIPLLSYFPMDSVENKGVLLDGTDSQIVSSKCVFHGASKTFHWNGLCLCDSVKESGGSGTAENDLSSATEPFSISGKELVSSVKEKVDEAKWDISNVLLRPRVFCLKHAIEVEELLHSKGGGHVRVICHSDYLKIKAYAASIAEEIGDDLDFRDVPLENASQDDLNLINISIDEEEYQEDGKDWTSHLGVNLRYCVKLRKHSPSSQEQLPSALSQIFSACSPVSVVSGLRWLCRRSRTPAKPVGNFVERAYVSANLEGDVPTLKKIDTASSKAIQVYQSRRKKPSDLAFKEHNPPVKEPGNCKQNAGAICRSECIASDCENIGNLFTVPVFIVGNHKETQNNIEKQNVGPPISCINIADLNGSHLPVNPAVESCEVGDSILSRLNDAMIVSVPVRYQYSHVYGNISASNSSAMHNEEKSIGVSSTDFDEGSYRCLDSQVGMAIPESKMFEVKQLTEAATEDGSQHKLVDSCKKCPLLLTAGEDYHIQETPAEEQNTEGSPRFALLAEDRAYASRLFGDDSEMYIVPGTEETSTANCSVLGEGAQCTAVSSEDEVRKIGIPAVRESVLEGEVSEILLKQPLLARKSTGDNSKILQEPCPTKLTNGVPAIEGDVLSKLANNAAETKVITGHVGNSYCPEVTAERNEKKSSDLKIILYVRRRNKRNRGEEGAQECLESEKTVKVQKKAEAQREVEAQHNSNGFVRSPCEGLRPRNQTGNKILGRGISATKFTRRAGELVGQWRKAKVNVTFHCDIEGCHMRFRKREELQLHKRNRCTYKECGKRFSNHKYAMRHQRVHDDDRPLKCPWKGCKMSFKWEWARTEHLRLHTGEKPYRCKVAGCGLSFRFVSDFSRHRRKTGHFVSNNTQ